MNNIQIATTVLGAVVGVLGLMSAHFTRRARLKRDLEILKLAQDLDLHTTELHEQVQNALSATYRIDARIPIQLKWKALKKAIRDNPYRLVKDCILGGSVLYSNARLVEGPDGIRLFSVFMCGTAMFLIGWHLNKVRTSYENNIVFARIAYARIENS